MCIYPMLDRVLEDKGLTKKALANKINLRYQTFIIKCNGKNDFTLAEVRAVKAALGTELPLEVLFDTNNKAS